MARPQFLLAHPLLQGVDDLAELVVERMEGVVPPHEVERLDLVTDEGVDPVELAWNSGSVEKSHAICNPFLAGSRRRAPTCAHLLRSPRGPASNVRPSRHRLRRRDEGRHHSPTPTTWDGLLRRQHGSRPTLTTWMGHHNPAPR